MAYEVIMFCSKLNMRYAITLRLPSYWTRRQPKVSKYDKASSSNSWRSGLPKHS